jgi:hypothetical protein
MTCHSLSRIVLTLVAANALASPLAAQRMPTPALNPVTYKSPSGKYSLTIDPSDPSGGGPATYRCAFGQKTIWSSELPFTLCDAGITDEGVTAGFGYTHGPDGYLHFSENRGPGDFLVAIIDPTGKVRLKDATKRPHSKSQPMHSLDDPVGHGLLLDDAHDRLVVRTTEYDRDGFGESWSVYKLSSGARLPTLHPIKVDAKPGQPRFVSESVLAAKLIRGTPLTLVHYWRFDGGLQGGLGAKYALIDLDGATVWSKVLPRDYGIFREKPQNEKAQETLRHWIRTHGGILNATEKNKFDVYFAADSKRVTFDVNPGSDKWAVTETGQAPYSLPTTEPPKLAVSPPAVTALPERQLKSLGTRVLRGDQSARKPAIRNVRSFVIDGAGRFAFLREDDEQATFVVADPGGKVVRELPLNMEPRSNKSHWSGYGWIGADFLVTRSDFGADGKCRAWRIDMQSGRIEPIPKFDSPPVERLAGLADGAFVAFARMRSKFTIEEFVVGFNERAERIWTLKDDFNNKGPQALFSVQDIALTSTGEVAVLQGIINQIKFFDRNSHFLRQVDLEKTWRRKPNYVAGLGRDIEGGVIVWDFDGSPPFVRMKRDGSVKGGFKPKYADGRFVDTRAAIDTAPDGHLWTCDGHSLLRLDAEGIVDRVLGESPKSNQLERIAGVFVDPRDRIYVVDSRTGSIHVFEPSGQFSHLCQTKPSDFSKEIMFPAVTFNSRGDVYLGLGDGTDFFERKRPYLCFSDRGARLESVRLPARDCQFQTGTGNIVAKSYEDVSLVDATGKIMQTIRRGADGNWLERPEKVALAPNGSIAILSGKSRARALTVNLYKPNGDPVRTIPMPESIDGFPRLAYDGRRLVVAAEAGLLIYDGSGSPIQRSKIPVKVPPGDYYYPYITAGGRELALFDGKTMALHRFEMP